jgi:uncharacterized protein (TIGR01777 family)
MRVGIAGASGLIGTELVSALKKRGDEVVRFVRPQTSRSSNEIIRWDPSSGLVDENDLKNAGRFDAVIHLAGAGIGDKRWNEKRKKEILSSRTNSTNLLVATLRSMPGGVPHLISGSAIGFYGNRNDEVLSETSSLGTGFLSEVCKEWEDAALKLDGEGSSVALLRTGIVMSRAGGALKKQLPLFKLGLGGKLGSGKQWISPISLNDEVRSILWILDKKLSGPFNLVSPEPITNSQLTSALGKLLRRPTLLAVPKIALNTVLGSEMADQLVFSSTRVMPNQLLASGFDFEQRSISEIIQHSLS